MNTHSIRHAWFPPAIPKRKHDTELDSESEWPSAYRALSGPGLEPRPTKRLRHLEGGLAGLTLKPQGPEEHIAINTDPEFLAPSAPSPINQIHDASFDGEAEPYISSIYEFASPHTGFGSSAASLPLRGEVSEVNTSDEEYGMKDDLEQHQQQMKGTRIGAGVFVQGGEGMPGYTVYEPESGPEKRKRGVEDDEHGPEKKGKRTWYEPEKDRIVILDLDSSEDESATRSPRRRRSAFSLSSTSQGSSTRPRSQTETRKDTPEFIINPTLLSHISPGTGAPSIPREDNPAQAVILYKPAPWTTTDAPQDPEIEVSGIKNVTSRSSPASREVPTREEDAMDIDS